MSDEFDYTFPFGQPVRTISQLDRTPKAAFVLGVYASAVHARWLDPDGKRIVAALAVASEPEIFWRGEGAQEIIDGIEVPDPMGSLTAAAPNLNGPSGKALDEHYLTPLGLSREDAWLCDLLPQARRNQGQAEAIGTHYEPYVSQGIVPETHQPPRPKPGFLTQHRADEIADEIAQSGTELLITLGDEPIREFISRYTSAANLSDQDNYGQHQPVQIADVELHWLPLVHPRQAAGLGHHSPHWRQVHQKWANSQNP